MVINYQLFSCFFAYFFYSFKRVLLFTIELCCVIISVMNYKHSQSTIEKQREAAKQHVAKMRQLHGEDYWSKLCSKAGKASRGKTGFGNGQSGRQRASEAGKKSKKRTYTSPVNKRTSISTAELDTK